MDGQYTIRDHLKGVYSLKRDLPKLQEVKTSEQIVDGLKNSFKRAAELVKTGYHFVTVFCLIFFPLQCLDLKSPSKELEDNTEDTGLLSVYERAVQLVEEKKVKLHVKRQVFTVDTLVGGREVRLFPQPRCSCNPTRVCCHILAAQLSIGLRNEKTKKPNASAFMKRNRKQADKLSGRKKPRYNDVDRTAAKQENKEFENRITNNPAVKLNEVQNKYYRTNQIVTNQNCRHDL